MNEFQELSMLLKDETDSLLLTNKARIDLNRIRDAVINKMAKDYQIITDLQKAIQGDQGEGDK